MLSKKTFLIAGILATLLLSIGGIYSLALTWSKSPARTDVTRYSTFVTLTDGEDTCEILMKKKLVDNAFLCRFYLSYIQKSEPTSGTYQLLSSMTPREIFDYLSNENHQVKELKRVDAAQKWYVDILGPSQDFDLAKKIKAELREHVFNREWTLQKNGSEIVESKSHAKNTFSVIFLEENSDKRIESFQNSTDRVYLYRVWIKRLDGNVNVTFSAFEPPQSCIGPELSREVDMCRNWQRTIRPGVFNFPEDKLVKAVVNKLKSTPFN